MTNSTVEGAPQWVGSYFYLQICIAAVKHYSLLQQNVIYWEKSFVKFASVVVFTILPIILIEEGNFEDLGAYSQQL